MALAFELCAYPSAQANVAAQMISNSGFIVSLMKVYRPGLAVQL